MKYIFSLLGLILISFTLFSQVPDTWTAKSQFAGTNSVGPSSFSVNGKGYICAGTNTDALWEYDAVLDTWTQKAAYPAGSIRYAAAFTIGSKAYVGTGDNYTQDFYEYDPALNIWTQKADYPGSGRVGAVGFALGSKGYIGTGWYITYFNDFYEYNPANNTWSSSFNFPGPPRRWASSFVINGSAFIVAGDFDNTFYNDVWMYTGLTWVQFPSMPAGTVRYAAVGFSINNKGYICTGHPGLTPYLNDLWELSPNFTLYSFSTWSQKANFPGSGRAFAAAFSLNNRGYVGSGTPFTNDFWEYEGCTQPTPNITGALAMCQGNSTNLNAGGGYSSYLWNTGAATPIINVSTAGTYTVTVSNGFGCTGSASATVVVNPLPNPSITGITSICQGQTTVLNAGSGYSSYNWSIGTVTQSITVSNGGTYTVTVTDANGCTGSASVTVTTNSLPTPVILGNTTICQGQTTTLNAGFYSNYIWSTGQVTQTIVVGIAGPYTVTVTDNNGCTGTTTTVITVNLNPLPTVTANGPTSFCLGDSVLLTAPSGYITYLWMRYFSPVQPNVFIPQFYAKTRGSYYCTVTDVNGCVGSSNFIDVPYPCIPIGPSIEKNNNQNENDFEIYPNPSNGNFLIQFDFQIQDKIEAGVFDSKGKLIYSNKFEGSQNLNFTMSAVPGFYIVELSNQQGQKYRKPLVIY